MFIQAIDSLVRKHSLTKHEHKRLLAEFELTKVKLDYSIHKMKEEDLTIYQAITKYMGYIRFDRENSSLKFKDLMNNIIFLDKSEITTDFLNSVSYDLFLLSDRVQDILEKVEYKECFHYTLRKEEGAALHFRNATMPVHPLKGRELDKRKQELAAIAKELKYDHPYIEYVFSLSWMWNVETLQKLMPSKFIEDMKEFTDITAYRLGNWGQFYRYDGTLNYERLEQFKLNYEFPLKFMLVQCSLNDFVNYYLK